jgi:mono/diheme cytochrome c family protein
MKQRILQVAATGLAGAALAAAGLAAGPAAKSTPTFTRDVAPILYKNCVECHRPGEVAPMSLLSYDEVRPWARSIREKISDRSMPPWLADPQHGRFENDRRLAQKDIETVVAWVNAGTPKGDDRDAPPPPKFVEGWGIGKPDVVLSMLEEYPVPADGVVPYKYFTIPTSFTEDKWVTAIEFRPGNRAVVHHIIGFIQEPGQRVSGDGGTGNFLGGTAPGDPPNIYTDGLAKRIPAGSKIIFQMHYTPNGEATKDRSSVGLVFAKEPVRKTAMTGAAMNVQLRIPPGASAHEVKSSWTAREDVQLIGLMPHMHVRGKDFLYTAVFPDGRSEVVLNVPRYDFNWQLAYKLAKPIALPKGTRIDCVAHFDNSSANKYNPDPSKEVRWGDQTWEEMMIGWFTYTRDAEKLGGSAATGVN